MTPRPIHNGTSMAVRYPIFVKRDLDGFFGLAIDNLVQLLLIVSLCGGVCGMSGEFSYLIYRYILPGAAVSLLIGNIFYALQAHWVAHRERRSDVTALPFGINTPSLLVFVFFVMKPAFDRTHDPVFAWKLGLIACLGSGIIEFAGAFVAERFRRNTPRAALLSTLAGIAIAFISMTFALQIWQRPLVTMVPLAIILLTYFARARFPIGLPGGLLAVLLGTGLAWGFTQVLPATWANVTMDAQAVRDAWAQHGKFWPKWVGITIRDTLLNNPKEIVAMLSVVIPMGLFNLIGSLQNIESAEAGGDVFATGPSLAVNGIGTIAAACFGSCFPTTIYIGHPGWKALGARAGYSTLNGLAMSAICLTGTVLVISKIIPIEAGIPIVLWIGIVITAQAFQASPVRHAPAVAIGLFPAIAAWGATLVAGSFIVVSHTTSQPAHIATMQDVLTAHGTNIELNGFLLHGLNILERGYIFTCMIVAAISAFLIDRRFYAAAGWAFAAAVLTLLGLIHAYQLTGNVVGYLPIFTDPAPGAFVYHGYDLAVGYFLMAILFSIMGRLARKVVIEPPANTLEDARVMPAEV
jgi:adenine/guanine/hypoxanthine permease